MYQNNQNYQGTNSPPVVVEGTPVEVTATVIDGNSQIPVQAQPAMQNQGHNPYFNQDMKHQGEFVPEAEVIGAHSVQSQYSTQPQYSSQYAPQAQNFPNSQSQYTSQSQPSYKPEFSSNQPQYHTPYDNNYSLPQQPYAAQSNQYAPEQVIAQQNNSMASYNPQGRFGFMQGKREFVIKQQFAWMEAAAQAVGFGCIEQENKYNIYDKDGQEVFYVKEKSNVLIRCCCHPNHEAKLFVYDTRHPQFNPKNLPKQLGPGTPLVMMVDKPFKLNCCVCHDFCMQEQKATLASDSSFIGSANKKNPWGGCFTPNVEVRDKNKQIYANVIGPTCCVGGLVELCTSIKFKINETNTNSTVGEIKKKKPKGMGALQEATSDSDQFFLSIPQKFDDEQAANFLATLLLLDYMFFEGGAPLEYDALNQQCKINCFNCYFLGCVWPCHCTLGGNSSDS